MVLRKSFSSSREARLNLGELVYPLADGSRNAPFAPFAASLAHFEILYYMIPGFRNEGSIASNVLRQGGEEPEGGELRREQSVGQSPGSPLE